MKQYTFLPPGKNYKDRKNYDADSTRVKRYPDEQPDTSNKSKEDNDTEKQQKEDVYNNPEVDTKITNTDEEQTIY